MGMVLSSVTGRGPTYPKPLEKYASKRCSPPEIVSVVVKRFVNLLTGVVGPLTCPNVYTSPDPPSRSEYGLPAYRVQTPPPGAFTTSVESRLVWIVPDVSPGLAHA